jgi:hypothetical protein
MRKVAKQEPSLAAEGAVIFIERVSPAIEQVDSSSSPIARRCTMPSPIELPSLPMPPRMRARATRGWSGSGSRNRRTTSPIRRPWAIDGEPCVDRRRSRRRGRTA